MRRRYSWVSVEHGLGHLGVLIVEVGLMVEESVPVELLPLRVPGPVGGLGVDEDHAGVAPALAVVAPHVPIGLRVGSAVARLLEPRVLVGRVVHHEISDDPDPSAMGLVEEHVDVVDRARLRQHGVEVADVVAPVTQGRPIEGQQPQAVDAEPLEVVEPLLHPPEVAETVAVGVGETPHRHLVEDGTLVPTGLSGVDRRRHPAQAGTSPGAGARPGRCASPK
jgi:hypothetical protein